jgi:hypothetical protein
MGTITLNIPYDMPEEKWQELVKVYENMPGWAGYILDGCPVWKSISEEEKSISASVEPSGLVIDGNMSDYEFNEWLNKFTVRASNVLGFIVKDAEE